MSLQTVADSAGISIAMLSQTERGISSPNFATVKAICKALEMPLEWLFDDAIDQHRNIVPAGKRRVMDLGPKTMRKELLTPDSVRGIQMMTIRIPPGVKSAVDRAPGCYKCGTVISGKLGLNVSGEINVLKEGDSLAFSGDEVHQYWCEGSKPVDLIWCVTPAIY